MTDDLIERLEAFEQRCVEHEVATFRKGLGAEIYSYLIAEARDALTAAQARIAELEAALTEIYEYPSGQPMALNMDEEGWQRHRAERMRYIAREALKSKGGELQPMRCAECNCENGGDDCNWVRSANERPKTSNADAWQLFLSECDYGHPYIAVQIAEAIDAAHERGRLQGLDEAAEKAMDASHFVDDETGVRWCDQHEAVALIEALKTKGGE